MSAVYSIISVDIETNEHIQTINALRCFEFDFEFVELFKLKIRQQIQKQYSKIALLKIANISAHSKRIHFTYVGQ
jgi:hypothetical protein